MLEIQQGNFGNNCAGHSRRTAIKAGFLGVLGLSTADLLRLRAEGAAKRNSKSVILIWLDGGPSHMETYDPKPAAAGLGSYVSIWLGPPSSQIKITDLLLRFAAPSARSRNKSAVESPSTPRNPALIAVRRECPAQLFPKLPC